MQPNKYFLVRKKDKETDKLLNQMGLLVDEVVNYGTHVLDICQEKETFTEIDTPIATTYTQFLTIVDSISILIRKGTSDGIKPLLRSLLETKFNLEYLIKEEPKKGVLAYQVSHIYNKITEYKISNSYTPEGKDFRKKLGELDIPTYDTREKINALQKLLETPLYKEVNDEWKRFKKENNRKPNWHALFDGPKRVEDLAFHLGQAHYYEVLYRSMSSFIHGGSSMNRLKKGGNEYGINPGIRRIEEIPMLLNYTVVFALEIYQFIIGKYNPEKLTHYAIWYLENIAKDFKKFTDAEINVDYILEKQHTK